MTWGRRCQEEQPHEKTRVRLVRNPDFDPLSAPLHDPYTSVALVLLVSLLCKKIPNNYSIHSDAKISIFTVAQSHWCWSILKISLTSDELSSLYDSSSTTPLMIISMVPTLGLLPFPSRTHPPLSEVIYHNYRNTLTCKDSQIFLIYNTMRLDFFHPKRIVLSKVKNTDVPWHAYKLRMKPPVP